MAGSCEAREGRLDAAHARLRVRGRSRPTSPLTRWWTAALDGEIALAEKDYDRAERILRKVSRRGKCTFHAP